MFKNKIFRILLGLVLALLALWGIYNIPFVHDKLSWRIDDLRSRITYYFNPPDEAVFVPVATVLPTPQVLVTLPPTDIASTATPVPFTATPTPNWTPVPQAVSLPGVKYVDQHNRWNYCGPANLTMALNFWGWKGDRDDVARVVKPGVQDPALSFIDQGKPDKNVMPGEMVDFVVEKTEYRALMRYGGEMELLKRLVAAGFPVVIEKGYFERDAAGKVTWMGHYLFVTGYDDSQNGFIVQDAYTKPGKDIISKYDIFQQGWRAFNYLFMVVYPVDRESQVMELMGSWADDDWADRHALEIANAEVEQYTGMDGYFAWFNKGTSHNQLLQYPEAALAYDKAFGIYATLGQDDKQRPYRMMWYQTGPYRAYFQTGRYQDVINLANTTFKTISEPTLEESLYWRAMAEYALGDRAAAIADMTEAVRLNKNFDAGIIMLREWGVIQ